jgi:hypothetical protein
VTKNYIELKSDQFVIFMESLNAFIVELIKGVPNDVLRGLKHISMPEAEAVFAVQ